MGSLDNGTPAASFKPGGKPLSWFRDGFFLTTDKACLDPKAVNDIFDSDLMWWNKPMDLSSARTMLENCMTFAIFAVPDTEEALRRHGSPLDRSSMRLVGFARLVTDYITFAYLTDVFVLKSHQRRGLARWMMRAIRETLTPWPYLRGLVLMTGDEAAARMYRQELGAVDINEGPSKGLVLLEMPGKGEVAVPEGH
ncbi:hypothetical protein NLU13_7676 [Sarocladium strictum]|uniref:N-acetyltransferase domain-containing protein n=1 Tax=Sarocladium strictum TaxID=5046 RepID=A0AA39GEF1_SARSR|nr:hypothetical protein NLU13_7676 [Sarocladium strictum]